VIYHALERRGVPAKRDRCKIDHQIAVDERFGDGAVVIIQDAHAGGANKAVEIAGAMADLFLTQDDVFHIPALGLELPRQRCADALASMVICA
jgi:hypothetical protein